MDFMFFRHTSNSSFDIIHEITDTYQLPNCIYFADKSVEELVLEGNAFAKMFSSWPSPHMTLVSDEDTFERLDAHYECWSWPGEEENATLRWGGSACDTISIPNADFVLMSADSCPYQVALENVAASGIARGVVLVAREGDRLEATSTLVECNDVFGVNPLIGTMVHYSAGERLRKRIIRSPTDEINITFTYSSWPGLFAAVDVDGNAFDIGWEKYPTLQMLSWAGDWQAHIAAVRETQHSVFAIGETYTVFNNTLLASDSTVEIQLPSWKALRDEGTTGMYVAMRLKCVNSSDGSGDELCGEWDRVLTVDMSCEGDYFSNTEEPGGSVNELQRWVTPFRRAIGEWVTDITPLSPRLGTGDCTFTASVGGEQWVISLTLHAISSDAKDSLVPVSVTPIVYPNMQTTFNSTYNEGRTFDFTAPVEYERAIIRALITGHGSDPPPPVSQGCEYAPTSHHWTITSASTTCERAPQFSFNSSDIAYAQYMLAGSAMSCADQVINGEIPNGHGDWYNGRNGWCPGQVVHPVVFDVSDAFRNITEYCGSSQLKITYNAIAYYVGGSSAYDGGCGGTILMSSFLSYYT